MSDIIKVKVVSKENNFTKIIEASLDMTYEELIIKFFKELQIEPNFKDVFFYVVNNKTNPKDQKDQKYKTLRQLNFQNDAYLIYLDEKNYVGKSPILYKEHYDDIHKADGFCQIPFFLENTNGKLYLDKSKRCKKVPYNTENKKITSFPIIIIDEKYYNQTIAYIKNCNRYFDYKIYPLLLNELVIDSSTAIHKNYQITHAPNKDICSFFAEVTDTDNSNLFPNLEQKQKIIKKILNYGNFEKNFIEEIQKWVRLIFNICAEYLLFVNNLKPIYFCCDKCKYPVLFLDETDDNPDIDGKQLVQKFYNKINDQVDLFNNVLNLINVDYLPNNNINKEDLLKINILYYDSAEKENTMRGKIDEIEEKINGTIILSCHMESFQVILEELDSKINEEDNIKFELVVNGDSSAEIMQYLEENEYLHLFNGVCIRSSNSNNPKLTALMEKYKGLIKVILQNIKVIFEYIKNNSPKLSNPYKVTKLITIQNYKYNYHFFHEMIAKYYGKTTNKLFVNAFRKLNEFIRRQKSLQIKTDSSASNLEEQQKALLKVIGDNFSTNIDLKLRIKNQIKNYTSEKESFYRDFNYWLRELDPIAFETIAFFTSEFMYSLNKYAEEFDKGFKENITLYRGIKISFIDLSFYKRNKGNIITFSNFVSTSTSSIAAKSFSGLKKSCYDRRAESIFSLTYKIHYLYKNKYVPCSIDIHELSQYKSEDERLFLPFSFFRVLGCSIDFTQRLAVVELEAIGRLEILEKYINDKNIITYNKEYNIMTIPGREISTDLEKSNPMENIDDEDTLSMKIDFYEALEKKCGPLEKFNKIYRCNLKLRDKEVEVESHYVDNDGYSLLSIIPFQRLTRLCLIGNKVQDLAIDRDFYHQFLYEIDLRSNIIGSINGIRHYCFHNLTRLTLADNQIEDISILENNNFNNLNYLDISNNKIKDISVFKIAHFTDLERLNLSDNPILNIELFNEANQLTNLRELNFQHSAKIKHRITNINRSDENEIELVLKKLDFIQNYIVNNEISITTNIQNEKKFTLIDIANDCKNNKMEYILDDDLFVNSFKKTILYNVLDDKNREKILNDVKNEFFEYNDQQMFELENLIEKTYAKIINNLKLVNYNFDDNYFILNLDPDIFSNITKINLSGNGIENLYVPSNQTLKTLITLDLSNNEIKNLSILKYIEFPYLTKLLLNNNKATFFDFNDLSNMQNLIELTLFSNKIKDIYNLDTAPLDNFKYLDLHDNELTEFIYKNTQKIITIDLSHNHIDKVEVNNNLLQNFNLDVNEIKDLKFLENSYFPNLTQLRLRSNKIKNVEVSNEAENKNLTFLDLGCNQITAFSGFKMKLIKLYKLYLDNNETLYEVESLDYCHLQSLRYLYLNNNDFTNIDRIKVPDDVRLIVLNLSYNKIKQLTLFKYINLGEIQYLNLSHNLITDISTLKNINSNALNVLDLSYNKIEDISPLKDVDFSKNDSVLLSNNLISSIEPLRGKDFKNLRVLDVSYNKIQKINIIITMKFNNLKELRIKNNEYSDQDDLKIKDFGDLDYIDIIVDPISSYKDFNPEPGEERFFHNEDFSYPNSRIYRLSGIEKFYFDRTKKIDLSNNKLYSIHLFKHADLSLVSELNLSNNYIFSISSLTSLNKGRKESSLTKLDLSNNWIKELRVFKYVYISKLVELVLNNNQIEDISPLYNIKPNLIENIELNDNKIGFIRINKSLSFDQLKTLKLMNNPIKTIEINSPIDCLSLQKLFLNDCAIENITFSCQIDINFSNIENLDLSKNKLDNVGFMRKIRNNRPSNDRRTTDKILDFSSNKIKDISALRDVELKNFTDIIFNNNQIKDIGCFSEHDLSELVKLDLRNNQIKDFYSLTTIRYEKIKEILIKNNPILNKSVFKKCDFGDLDHIDIFVDLEEENKYQDLSDKSAEIRLNYSNSNIYRLNDIYSIINEKLTEIDLSNNKIYSIISFKDRHLSNLTILNLSNNMIYNIEPLKSLSDNNGKTESKLKILNLSSNWIKSLKVFNELKITNLTQLYLNDNQIEEIEPLYNIKEKELTIIDISNNKIEKIEVNQKFDFDKLITLKLNNNYIYAIKITEEIKLSSLEDMYLNKNAISDIKIKDYVIMKHNKFNSIDLTENKLISIWYLDNIKIEISDEERKEMEEKEEKEKEEKGKKDNKNKNQKKYTKFIDLSKNFIKKTKEIKEKIERLIEFFKVDIITS